MTGLDDGAGLPGTGGHDEQGVAAALPEGVADGADGALLVVPAGDRSVHRHRLQREPPGAPRHEVLELGLREEAVDATGRVAAGFVPQLVFVAGGDEDDRPAAEPALERVGVELGLLLAHLEAGARALRLHDGEWEPVVAPEDVVDDALPLLVGHAVHRVLAVVRALQEPSGLGEQRIDEIGAGLSFLVVARVRGQPGLQLFELLAELGELPVLLGAELLGLLDATAVRLVADLRLLDEFQHLLPRHGGALFGEALVESCPHRQGFGLGGVAIAAQSRTWCSSRSDCSACLPLTGLPWAPSRMRAWRPAPCGTRRSRRS